MDLAALALAGLSLVVSVLALLSSRSKDEEANRIAREALDEARSVKTAEAWAAVIRSTNHRMTLNPTAEDAGPILRDSRADLMALVDALPEWTALGDWLANEHVLGAAAARADLEDMGRDRDALPDLSARWGAALTQNLRRFRATGYDEQTMHRLTASTREQLERLHTSRGWELPAETMEGVEPLDKSS